MVAVASLKRWFLFSLRRAVGTQMLIEQIAAQHSRPKSEPSVALAGAAGASTEALLASSAADKLRALHMRIADSTQSDEQLGFRREHVPVPVDLNGDLIWLPGDLLKFVWHTRHDVSPAFVVHLLAETPHYLWIRERLRPGDTAIDCGANLGLFATMMAARVGPTGSVHAFEPSPRSRRDLARVVHLNEFTWVTINGSAVSNQCGKAAFCDVLEGDVRREASHLSSAVRFTAGLAQQMIEVPVTTLDQYIAETGIRPRLVKIDVEGAELEVLDGAQACLRDCRPLLVVEFHPDAQTGMFDHDRLQKLLTANHYSFQMDNREYFCEPR